MVEIKRSMKEKKDIHKSEAAASLYKPTEIRYSTALQKWVRTTPTNVQVERPSWRRPNTTASKARSTCRKSKNLSSYVGHVANAPISIQNYATLPNLLWPNTSPSSTSEMTTSYVYQWTKHYCVHLTSVTMLNNFQIIRCVLSNGRLRSWIWRDVTTCVIRLQPW